MTTDVRIRALRWLTLAAGLLAAGPTVSACAGPKAVATGEQASSFTLPPLVNSSHRISLNDYAGKPVIINFCASWVPACPAETELLGHFFRYHHGQVLIIGVDARDERAAGLRQLRQSLVTYPVATDATLAVGARFHVPGLPATSFLDSRHEIVETELGWLNWRKIRLGVKAMDSGRVVEHPNGE
jgi:thiol-disulfide isomerase/thioredoxin